MVKVESHWAHPARCHFSLDYFLIHREGNRGSDSPSVAMQVSHQVTGAAQTRHCRKAFVKPNIKSEEKNPRPLNRRINSHQTKQQPLLGKWSRPFLNTDDEDPQGCFLPLGKVSISQTHFMLRNNICVLLSLLGRSQSANGWEVLPAHTSVMVMMWGWPQIPPPRVPSSAGQTPLGGESRSALPPSGLKAGLLSGAGCFPAEVNVIVSLCSAFSFSQGTEVLSREPKSVNRVIFASFHGFSSLASSESLPEPC